MVVCSPSRSPYRRKSAKWDTEEHVCSSAACAVYRRKSGERRAKAKKSVTGFRSITRSREPSWRGVRAPTSQDAIPLSPLAPVRRHDSDDLAHQQVTLPRRSLPVSRWLALGLGARWLHSRASASKSPVWWASTCRRCRAMPEVCDHSPYPIPLSCERSPLRSCSPSRSSDLWLPRRTTARVIGAAKRSISGICSHANSKVIRVPPSGSSSSL